MPRTRNTRKNDVYLMMECREEQLSSAQIDAYKKAEQEYEVSSKTIEVIMKNSEKLYEKGDVSLVYFKNNISNPKHLEITTDNETVLFNTDAENSGEMKIHDMYKYSVPVNDSESLSLTPTVVSLNNTALKHPATFYTTNYQLFIVGGLPQDNIEQDTASKDKNPIINPAVQIDSINKSTPTLYSTVNNASKIRNNSCDGSPMNLFNQNIFIMAPVSEQEDLLPSFREKKMFPSLVAMAKPYLVIKAITLRVINEEQRYLDEKVKILLTYTVEKFTEWLLNQGFIHNNQLYKRLGNAKQKLNRAMYLDSSQFSHSEGCVWVNDCCPRKCFSIFNGSIFEGSSLSLGALLKLLYHWSSQTNAQNVVQWVKVNNTYLKKFYTNLRAVCVAAVHEEYKTFLGGKSRLVEVGVICLGTLSRNTKKHNIKMWILGAMESKRNLIKLYALEPLQGNEQNSTAHFVKILEPLISLVHKESIILIDSTLDKNILYSMGYNNVIQTTVQDKNNKSNIQSNENIMLYLTKCIPHMFQNTFSYLSRQIIQQFLDELVWRERWGQTSLRAFHSIINHIGEQTKIYSGKSLISCLSKIAINPFINWQYSQWKTNMKSLKSDHFDKNLPFFKTATNSSTPCSGVQDLNIISANSVNKMTQPLLSIKKKSVQSELKNLENYYYGISPGNEKLLELDKKCELQIKCVLCSSVLKTNICLMKHLIKHALSTRIYTIEESISWCKYCLKGLKFNPELINLKLIMNKHTEETHFKSVHPNFRCRICEEDFRYRTRLILHMHCFHTEIEMPYECGICKFRSSEHHLVVDHFYETHNNGEKAQCPLCLKIVAFKDKGNKITQNIYFFLNHIRKHTYKKLVRKCKKCVLSFVNKGILEYHQRMYHRSCKDIPNLKRYDSSNSVLMPTPSSCSTEKIQSQSVQEIFFKDFTCNELNLTINTWKNMENMTCCECEGYFLEEDHFPGYLSCLKCSFNTCCDKTMFEHIVKFHDNVPNTYKEGIPIILEEPMSCVCGFKSVLGNKLADHLIKCGKKTVYPSIDEVAENNITSHYENKYHHGDLSESDMNIEWSQELTMIKEEEEYVYKENYEDVDTKDMSSNMLSALGLIPNRSLIKDDHEKYGENCQTIKHKFEEMNSYVNKSLLKKQKLD